MTICIIPARAGSTRIKNKNIKDFHGKPIIQYSIETAEKSGLFDEIVVSTDGARIASIAKSLNVTVYMRPEALGENDVGTQEVARDVLIEMNRDPEELVCVLYATSPLLDIQSLIWGRRMLTVSRKVEYSYSAGINNVDAGNYYWGRAEAFINEIPLRKNSIKVPIPYDRFIDINTLSDWEKAERMYLNLKGH